MSTVNAILYVWYLSQEILNNLTHEPGEGIDVFICLLMATISQHICANISETPGNFYLTITYQLNIPGGDWRGHSLL